MINDDSISRKAAIEELWRLDISIRPSAFDAITDMLKTLPPAQAEIIRCKDCKYGDRGIDEDGNPFLKCLGWVYGGTQEEDFCSHAERRTDE